MPKRRVAVICTVLNEEATVAALLESLMGGRRSPDEIVVVDGGSTDHTVQLLESFVARGWPLRLIVLPGSNISAGRNEAIAAANAELIACTDAGVRLSPQWLDALLTPFDTTGTMPPVDVVAGFFQADPRSLFEVAMGATALPLVDEIHERSFLPSSRSVAYTKEAWARAGGYPEWLDYCEDIVFDLALRRAGCRMVLARDAIAHFRPRSSVRAFFRQYYLYARGDGKADLWPRRHFVRYASYGVGALVLLLGFWYKVAWLVLLAAGLVYLYRPYRRLWAALGSRGPSQRLLALFLVPVLRVVGDVAKMAGYPVGVLWRWRKQQVV